MRHALKAISTAALGATLALGVHANPAASPSAALQTAPSAFAPVATTPTAAAPAALAPSAQLQYRLSARISGIPLSAPLEVQWQQDGHHYTLRQTVRHFLGTRAQTSAGTLTAQGLAPVRFVDTLRENEKVVEFDRGASQIRFGTGRAPVPLQTGAQDVLSVQLQLGALLASQPARYGTGALVHLQVANPHNTEDWTLRVEDGETLTAADRQWVTRKLVRLGQGPNGFGVELWVAPELHGLPVRVRITQANGDVADQLLQSYTLQTPAGPVPTQPVTDPTPSTP